MASQWLHILLYVPIPFALRERTLTKSTRITRSLVSTALTTTHCSQPSRSEMSCSPLSVSQMSEEVDATQQAGEAVRRRNCHPPKRVQRVSLDVVQNCESTTDPIASIV